MRLGRNIDASGQRVAETRLPIPRVTAPAQAAIALVAFLAAAEVSRAGLGLSTPLAATLSGTPGNYWDANGAIAGAGGLGGNWSGATWSSDPLGTVATGVFASGSKATFSAGSDGGTYTINIDAAVSSDGLKFEEGSVTLAHATGGALTLTGPNIDVASGATGTISAAIGGTVGLAKVNAGTLVLRGPNTYTGTTSLTGGTLSVSADAHLGAAPASATPNKIILNGGTLATTSSFTMNASRGIGIGAVMPPGTATNYTGTIDVAEGTTLAYGGVIANAANSLNVRGILVKSGGGALVLTGASTHTGGTTISAGSIRANNPTGSALGTGIVTIGGSGTLGGSGAINNGSNLLSINSGGTITAGEDAVSTGSLATGAQGWNGGGTYLWKIKSGGNNPATDAAASVSSLAGASWDKITLSSLDLGALGGANKFTITLRSFANGATPGALPASSFDPTKPARFLIASVTGGFPRPTNAANLFTINAADFVARNPGTSGGSFSLSFGDGGGSTATAIYVNYEAAPEPTTALLFALGAAGILGSRRRVAAKLGDA